ncbi:MAG TPA: DUF2970 domain-containing protein [Burkholderiales bacterium]|nr:DUF2970 domain-containing protein [Burkholderiales bacterium]
MADQQQGRPAKISPLRLFRTVFWSFFGVRRRSDDQADLAGITPMQVIIAGIVGAAIFVGTLILLARFIVG